MIENRWGDGARAGSGNSARSVARVPGIDRPAAALVTAPTRSHLAWKPWLASLSGGRRVRVAAQAGKARLLEPGE